MLVTDVRKIGNRLLQIRKRCGLTQAEAAERAEMSDRAYADIERGTVCMRVDTLLKICEALRITPDELLVEQEPLTAETEQELTRRLNACVGRDRDTALRLLTVYLQSLE